jgi:NAD dependent epimerase/dehydratase family enzyme
MSPDRGGAFHVLSWLARLALGGAVAGGAQYVSWIHEHDFAAAVQFLIDRHDMSGPINLAAPNPEPHVACQEHGTTLKGFLPRARDHPVASDGTTRRVGLGVLIASSFRYVMPPSRST